MKLVECSFEEVKNEYRRRRVIEKHKIIKMLLKQGYVIKDMSFKNTVSDPFALNVGHGKKDYTSNGEIDSYDLRNWQWINAEKQKQHITITLQPQDVDMITGNSHTLFDRIGFIYRSKGNKPLRMITNVDLPLDDNKLREISNALENFRKGLNDESQLDECFERAGRLVIEKDRGSIGTIQRFFRIGFNHAERIMNQLCAAGVVSEEDGIKSRRVLMTMEEFEKEIELLRKGDMLI